jgi:hypothetical protein
MAKRYEVEFDQEYEGLRYVGIITAMGHRCGYVGVDSTHPLFGFEHYNNLPKELLPLWEEIKNEPAEKRSSIEIFCCDPDNPKVRVLFDVHGGITYSGSSKNKYPVESDKELWFFGFDCNHAEDQFDRKSQEYVEAECISLAEQLIKTNGGR